MSSALPTKMDSNLEGQLLIAMPTMADSRFCRSVIYLCAHSDDGAMGLIVNQPASNIRFSELLEQLDILDGQQCQRQAEMDADRVVLAGGPVDTSRGFVLHSRDYYVKSATLEINDGVCLTATTDILRAIATGIGPERSMLALGYAGWAPGQLESEIARNGWLHCAADQSLLFDVPLDRRYELALAKLGIASTNFSPEPGHA